MNILFVTSTLTSGGSERVMSLLANQLAERGHKIEIVNLNKHIVFYPIQEHVKLSFAEDEVGKSLIKKMLWLRNHVKIVNPHIVIAFMTGVYCTTLMSLLGSKTPVIVSERIDPKAPPLIRRALRCLLLPSAAHLIVQTNKIKAFYPAFIQKKTSVIYNPVVEEVFSIKETDKKKQIITTGRLYTQKNQKLLIGAFNRIEKDFPDYQLLIRGEGPLRKDLENQIAKLHLEHRILLPGRTNHIIKELNESKLFVLSSNEEGLSNSMIEAACVGLPIVTTSVSGSEELVENGKNGFIVPVGDEFALSKAMKKLLASEEMMQEFGKRSKEKSNAFRIDTITNEWEKIIKQVIKRKNEL